jgi:hypothetical protein
MRKKSASGSFDAQQVPRCARNPLRAPLMRNKFFDAQEIRFGLL